MRAKGGATQYWEGNVGGVLQILDQTKLPERVEYVTCRTVDEVWEAIRSLRVRGAPAIGIAAAFGVVIGMQGAAADESNWKERLEATTARLATSRPTAVNLFWALERMKRVDAGYMQRGYAERIGNLLQEAKKIEAEDVAMCDAIGRHGANLIPRGGKVLTHCNAGRLATGGAGTALAVIYTAAAEGKEIQVYADETRPLLQGARLTAWELQQEGIPVTVICDSMAGWVMKSKGIDAVVVGADRIAANGDVANKIGTYSVACLAKGHGVPFYVAAPSSTFDLSISTGVEIPIEERRGEEITEGFGCRTAPEGVEVFNPAFDVTPAEWISGIITERGVIRPVNRENIRQMLT